jgi:hypothetical protein
MSEQGTNIKMGYLNPFTVGGALIGYWQEHTWQGAAWGFGAGLFVPFFLLCLFAAGLSVGSLLVRTSPRIRVDPPSYIPLTHQEQWEEAYRTYVADNNLPDELSTHSHANQTGRS